MPDAVKKMPVDRHSVEQRIGVLEELLDERYSCRAFRPDPVPRPIIDRILTAAQRTASWCNSQPWQVVIASGDAKERFRKLIYAEAASGSGDDHDFAPPREYLGVYQERRRESGFQLYNTLGIVRGDKAAYGRQARRTSPLFTPMSRSGSMVRSTAAPMSAISCWPRRRWASAPSRRQRWPVIPA